MSFIYNKDLLKTFQKIVQAQAQAQNFDKELIEHARNLIPLLEQQLDGKDVFTASRENSELNTTNLKDLDSLLFFLFFNKITHNGTVIVLKTNPNDQNYVPYSENGVEPYTYFIHKNSLIAYLKSLLNNENPVLKVMINKLIDNANSQLNLNLSKDTLKEPKDKSTKNQISFSIEDNTSEKTQQNIPNDQMAVKKEQSVQQQSAELFSELATNLPFDNQDIDFERIERFFVIYEKLNDFRSSLSSSRISATTSLAVARDAIKKVKSVTANGNLTNIPLAGMTAQQLTTFLKQPWISNYKYFIEYLILVLNNTRDVVSEFYNAYVRKTTPDSRVVMPDNLAQLVSGQNTIYNYNFHQLQDLSAKLGQVKR